MEWMKIIVALTIGFAAVIFRAIASMRSSPNAVLGRKQPGATAPD